ncbi:MAG: glycosyltransferase family 2 protein [Caldilineaceae bacterium]|nr:glycosyltransferase family 2 protein [Caldilineaceae bacterium]
MLEVSVILPTYNRLTQLQQVLAGLEKQSYSFAKFEVIVVSDGSTDGTNEYLQTFQPMTSLRLTPVLQENAGPAAARNHGIQVARGNYILFIDDDVVPVPHLLEAHMATHRHYRTEVQTEVVVMGPMHTPTEFNMKPWVR